METTEQFETTPFYDHWLDSYDLKANSLETEILERLRRGDVAMSYGWDNEFIVW